MVMALWFLFRCEGRRFFCGDFLILTATQPIFIITVIFIMREYPQSLLLKEIH